MSNREVLPAAVKTPLEYADNPSRAIRDTMRSIGETCLDVIQHPVDHPDNPEASVGSTEKEPPTELYRYILPAAKLPEIEPSQDAHPPIVAHISADNLLAIAGQQLQLQGDELFIFNVLLQNRDLDNILPKEIKEQGFRPDQDPKSASRAFTDAIKKLTEKLNDTTGLPIIIKTGKNRGTTYAINPALVTIDERDQARFISTEGDTPNRIARPEGQRNASTRAIITAIARAYKSHSDVYKAIHNQSKTTRRHTNPEGLLDDGRNTAGLYRILTAEEETKLFLDIEEGLRAYSSPESLHNPTDSQAKAFVKLAAAYQVLCVANIGLAINQATPYLTLTSGAISAGDIIHEAFVGLTKAIAYFDTKKGYKFSTYAVHWICQTTKRSIEGMSRTKHIPAKLHYEYLAVKGLVQKHQSTADRQLTKTDIEEITHKPISYYEELMELGRNHLSSLNELLDGGEEMGNFHPDPVDHIATVIETIDAHEEIVAIIHKAGLTNDEKLIIDLHFGIGPSRSDMTIAEIATKLNCSQHFVKQRIASALEKCQLMLEARPTLNSTTKDRL